MPKQHCHKYENGSLRLSLPRNQVEPRPVTPLSPSRASPGQSTVRVLRRDWEVPQFPYSPLRFLSPPSTPVFCHHPTLLFSPCFRQAPTTPFSTIQRYPMQKRQCYTNSDGPHRSFSTPCRWRPVSSSAIWSEAVLNLCAAWKNCSSNKTKLQTGLEKHTHTNK